MTDDHKAEALDLDALGEVARKATPGPWHIGDANAAEDRVYGALWVLSTERTSIERDDGNPPEEWFAELHVGRREDAELIAAAVNALPALIAALKEAQAGLADAWDEGCIAGRNREHHTNMTREQAASTWPNPYRNGGTP